MPSNRLAEVSRRPESETWAEFRRIELALWVLVPLLIAAAVALLVSVVIESWWLWLASVVGIAVCWLWSRYANRRLRVIEREIG